MRISHGQSKGYTYTRFYGLHMAMKRRCNNPNTSSFSYYGGRGIKVCKEWLSFTGFMKDMHESYLKHVAEFGEKQTTLDRIDSNGPYSKENCRWATNKQQFRNTRRNKVIEFNGKKQTLADWADELGVKQDTLGMRFLRGWATERALTEPFN